MQKKTDMNKRHILFTSRQEAQEKLRRYYVHQNILLRNVSSKITIFGTHFIANTLLQQWVSCGLENSI